LRSSSRVPASSSANTVSPVMFLSGRAKLATNPDFTGSPSVMTVLECLVVSSRRGPRDQIPDAGDVLGRLRLSRKAHHQEHRAKSKAEARPRGNPPVLQHPRYSITSSARASIDGGIVSRSAFAVLRLITNSNLVGCSTGRSAGLVPLRILST
jgi:hypothetical protein